jgi:4-alpha-glucanotransferase
MAFQRSSGILAHPTSFPGPHGIGDLGDGSNRFIDWLAAAGQTIWQLMPLVPTGEGNSPYSSPSAFAGNPLLISLEKLVDEGLLDQHHVTTEFGFPDDHVEYVHCRRFKMERIRWAFERFDHDPPRDLAEAFAAFQAEESSWLLDFARFMAIKHEHDGKGWLDWEPGLSLRAPAALAAADERLAREIRFHEFTQYLFRRQWDRVRAYAHDRNVQIIGDIPIFVAHDSADVWANQEQFLLDETGRPAVVAGVPPDYFSADGQLWGNPHYDWAKMRADDYAWWVSRFRNTLSVVDVIRIDHFRGFAAAWTVPAGAPTSASGWWTKGPGRSVFDAATNRLGDVPIVVEDLGLITADVFELRRDLGFPGMAVLQFAFDGDPGNVYIPHNYRDSLLVYTGTHDNQTTVGWFQNLDDQTRARVQTYLGGDGHDIAWDLIRLALASIAEIAIAPLQDVLRLGDEARMNTPGRPEGNWAWRFRAEQLDFGLAAGLARLTEIYGRDRRERPPRGYDPYDYTVPGTDHALKDPLT